MSTSSTPDPAPDPTLDPASPPAYVWMPGPTSIQTMQEMHVKVLVELEAQRKRISFWAVVSGTITTVSALATLIDLIIQAVTKH